MREDSLRPDYLRVRFAGEGQEGYRPVDQSFELYDGDSR